MDKESKPAWNVLGLDANLGTVRCGGKLTVRLGCSESQLRVDSSNPNCISELKTEAAKRLLLFS